MKFTKLGIAAILCVPLLSNATVIQITSMDQFNDQVLNSNKPAVVKVGATWCGACVRAKKPFEKISEDPQFAGVVFAEVDADASPDIMQKYSVQSLPTFVYINNGQKVDSKSGFSDNLKSEISATVSRMKSTGASAPAAQEPAMEKKTEELGQTPAEQPETPVAVAEETGTCAAIENTFFERAYNAVRDFFVSIGDTVRGWFR